MSSNYKYLWNCSGYDLNVYITGDCTGTVGGIPDACSWATPLPAGGTFMPYMPGGRTIHFGPAKSRGAPYTWSPVESGSFVVNTTSGALEFSPGTEAECGTSGPPVAVTRRKRREG